MRRREFILALGGAAAAVWPLAARAQKAANPARIGFLPIGPPSDSYDLSLAEVFRNGLSDAGLIEPRDVILDLVWVTNELEYAQAVIELISRGAKVLVPVGSGAATATKLQTTTVPIVFIQVGNPIGIGLVKSLSHPGGNATGFSDVLTDLSSKYLDLARTVSPPQAAVDYLWYGGWPDGRNRLRATEQAAQTSGVILRSLAIGDIAELDDLVASMKADGAATVIVQPSPFSRRHRKQIIESATNNRLTTIYGLVQAAREGGVIAYGPDLARMYRQAGFYIARILKGAKPADLPVEQPTKFELVINLKAAKALGLQVPDKLLALADEVIE
jgi:putative tryptophan/tyrosine transport system substrate-binding protein